MMKRRVLLTLGTGFAMSVLTGFKPPVPVPDKGRSDESFQLVDLEPDGLAKTYRRYRLLIIGQRDDERAGGLAQAAADVLARFLPDTRSKTIRAADTRRVGVLIGTRQQDIGVMSRQSAEALFQASPPFADVRNVPLRAIVSFGDYVLVCRTDFVSKHAYLLAKTLTEHKDMLPVPAAMPEGGVPLHEGAQAFFAGKAMPAG